MSLFNKYRTRYGLIHSFQNEVVHCLPKKVSARNNTGFICLPKAIINFSRKRLFAPRREFSTSRKRFLAPRREFSISRKRLLAPRSPVGNLTLEKSYTWSSYDQTGIERVELQRKLNAHGHWHQNPSTEWFFCWHKIDPNRKKTWQTL